MTIEYYHFPHPVRRVAVIGAGPSGLPAARHLRDAGLEVTIFERQSKVGGLWNWKEETSGPLSVPTPPPSVGAFTPSWGENGVFPDPDRSRRTRFNPPNPCYWSLTNNVPTQTMAFKDHPYPPGTEDSIPHYLLADYLQQYWEKFGLKPLTKLNTRVEHLFKRDDGKWEVHLRTQKELEGSQVRETSWSDAFDAVLVGTGHYNAPLIPNLPGAAALYARHPSAVMHSQGYRRPEVYAGQNVLVIGAGTSGTDIARDIAQHAKAVYVSARVHRIAPDSYQKFRNAQQSRLPDGVTRVPEVKGFRVPDTDSSTIRDVAVELEDGEVLRDIDTIYFSTGYQYSFPFLPQLHRDPGTVRKAGALVECGDNVLNLYRDVFYIPDPSLAFVGISINTSAFSFFEYQSISVARVWGGKARLPSQHQQREALREVVKLKSDGKFRHFMGKDGERAYVRETVDWLNADAKWSGAPEVEGHTAEWLWHSDQVTVKIAQKYGIADAGAFNGGFGGSEDLPTIAVETDESREADPISCLSLSDVRAPTVSA